LEFLPIERLKHQLDVNVVGQIAVTQAFLPLIRKSKGRVIMMSSIAGRTALPFVGPYCASKSALEALTDALRMEVKRSGIKVSIIQPGKVKTPIWQKSIDAIDGLIEKFPPAAHQHYQKAFEKLRRRSIQSGDRGIDPNVVVMAVLDALTSPRPRTRYLVGPDAKLRVFLEWLPDEVRDMLILSQIGP
jgi:NAD(P)-dependent dehydrogenase (short-subunit alcohol dehydrogenase family)